MTTKDEAEQRKQAAVRRDMDVGCDAADRIWDANRRRMTDGFFAGLIIKLLTLYATATTPDQMAQVWDSCSDAVLRLMQSQRSKQ